MISFIQGVLIGKTFQSALVDVNGLGLEVLMPSGSLAKLPELGNPVTIQTYFQVREDAMTLYGFGSEKEKQLFEKLISVSGVGPKVALAALSYYSETQLTEAIASQDIVRVSKIPGIGKKTAGRIILELKGSLELDEPDLNQNSKHSNLAIESATEALLAMGFTDTEIKLAFNDAPSEGTEGALIQYALKRLGSEY